LRVIWPSDAMFPLDTLLTYIGVPAVLVIILILIKLIQEKLGKPVADEFSEGGREEVQTGEEAEVESSIKVEETRAKPEISKIAGPQGCLNYLGYLYMKKAPNRANIPTECYNCPDLLKCLYSPVVVEKVYGE